MTGLLVITTPPANLVSLITSEGLGKCNSYVDSSGFIGGNSY
jgi:hypothetical protein